MIPFVKMHGLGNDFVIVDDRDGALALDLETRQALADRRRGIGCDQLLVLEKPTNGSADVFMRIFNPDGLEAQACGNGTRCVADLVMQELSTADIGVETIAGILPSKRMGDVVSVDMGEPLFGWRNIPLAREMDSDHLDLSWGDYRDPVAVNMGNPHCVFIVEDAEAVPLERAGPVLEHDPLFPERANIEFISKNADGSLRMRVWERGAGITQACGSGTCAAIVAASKRGLVDGAARVHLDGGPLDMEWRADGHVIMTGATALSFRGEWAQ